LPGYDDRSFGWSGRQDAALYGGQDARRYVMAVPEFTLKAR
jgi:hypothetical protein